MRRSENDMKQKLTKIDIYKQEKEIIYEGMFVNGFYHGVGRL